MIEKCFLFQLKLWQILGLFDIKNRLNIVVVIRITLDKNILFEGIFIAVKDGIVLIILPMFTLMTNQIYIYLYLLEKRLMLQKLK